MAGIDRRHAILERVAEEQTIHVGELARSLGVSDMTIRRDIRRLERDGFLRQTYGGATAHLTRSLDLAFNSRALRHVREKRLIGVRATALVADARVVFVGIGTTVEQFARYLTGRPALTIVTPSIPIASLLGTRPLQVVAAGGDVRRDELSCVGPIAASTVGRYRFDVAVVGAAALSARWGIGELTDGEAEVERIAIERSDRLVVVADGSKLGATAPVIVCPAEGIATLVTDRSAPQAELDALAALGVGIVLADDEAPAAGTGSLVGVRSERRAHVRTPRVPSAQQPSPA